MINRLFAAGLRAVRPPSAHTALYSVQVVVPSLGESISDGTIAAVLKNAGDPVKENDTIAQIETDKVTIDIKAPTDGTVLGVVVKEQDLVVPGQLVATVDDTAAQGNLIGATPAASASNSAQSAAAPSQSSPAAATRSTDAGTRHRVPGIHFPPRRTADGHRISALPAQEAVAIIQQWQTSTPTAGQPAVAPAATAAQDGIIHKAQGTSGPAATSGFAQPTAAQSAPATPSKFASSVTQLNRMPGRRELTEAEMELIELGGAAP
eukprot:GHRR01004477.1.p1 GENE.GHRR01004477.1~~GHRR01004477.1.p1  ORF type:complete len:264 (+),score=97.03 GHRR01004477.1:175-966(+)